MTLLTEILKRFAGKTPWFFKILQAISLFISLLLIVPDIFHAIQEGGFTLPATWTEAVQKAVGYGLLVQPFILQLTITTEEKKRLGLKE